MFKLLNLLIAVTLLTASFPVAHTSAQMLRAQPALLQLATDEPDEIIRVIVQKMAKTDRPEALVTELNGTVTRDLSIINAFVAEMPAKAIPILAAEPKVRWVSLDARVVKVNGITQDTISLQDDFNVVSFNANYTDGTWPSSWSEIGEADGPEIGNVRIARFHAGESQGVRLEKTDMGIQSEISLANAVGASLTIAYKQKGFESGDSVQVSISSNGGKDWAEVARLAGTTDAEIVTSTYDISAFVSDETALRFVTDFAPESPARFYIDSVKLAPTLNNHDGLATSEQMYIPFVSAAQKGDASSPYRAQASSLNTTEYVRDEFETVSFGNNDGLVAWQNDWTELGETDGPDTGEVRIKSVEIGDSDMSVLRVMKGEKGVQRAVDLANASSATLNFEYYRRNLDVTPDQDAADYVRIEISSDGGNNWAELDRIEGPDDSTFQPASYDISGYMASNTTIRLFSSPGMGNDNDDDGEDRIYFDNLEIVYTLSSAEVSNNSTSGPQSTEEFTGTLAIVRDEFNNVAFNNNDGSVSWVGDWVEVDGQSVGPEWGKVRIKDDALRLDRYQYSGADPSLARSLAFPSAVVSATLNFDFRTTGWVDPTDVAVVEISNDNGTTYAEIATIMGISGATADTVSVDISEYTSANATIRFRIAENYGGSWEYLFIDNVEVSYVINSCPQCIETANLVNPYIQTIGADRLWNDEKPLQGEGVGVAIIDTGIANHGDLQSDSGPSRIHAQVQLNSAAGLVDDFYGHGSHIAGTVGGNGSMSDGAYIGVAPRANLIDVKVIDDYGVGTISDVIAGLQWVLDHKDTHNIRVVNLSLSSTVDESYLTNPLNAAIEILWFNRVVVVVSAGNTGQGPIYPPANDPFAITVGATDDNGTIDTSDDILASYSAYGTTQDNISKPDIVAPGTNIISLLSSDDNSLALAHPLHKLDGVDGNNYFRMSGTSMASAVTAGAVALLLEDEPHLTPDQVKYRLMATAGQINGPAEGAVGAGYLDIYAAIHGTTTENANTNVPASQLLWSGSEPINWDSVNWDSVNWDSVNWDSVNWDSVNWDSVNWDSVNWDSVHWDD